MLVKAMGGNCIRLRKIRGIFALLIMVEVGAAVAQGQPACIIIIIITAEIADVKK